MPVCLGGQAGAAGRPAARGHVRCTCGPSWGPARCAGPWPKSTIPIGEGPKSSSVRRAGPSALPPSASLRTQWSATDATRDDNDARGGGVYPSFPTTCPAKGLPHRIRHYGLLAGAATVETIAKARDMLTAGANPEAADIDEDVTSAHAHPCACCGGRMMIVELFEPDCRPQHQPIEPKIRMDTSSATSRHHPFTSGSVLTATVQSAMQSLVPFLFVCRN